MKGLVAKPDEILYFWFGELTAGFADDVHRTRWFSGGEPFDEEIRENFAGTVRAAAAGKLEQWLDQPPSRLAYILISDQFPRNLFRGTARAYELDSRALNAARTGVTAGMDRALTFDERSFFYMPFEHSECLIDQHACVGLFSQLRDQTPGGHRHLTGAHLRYAHQHRDIVSQFSRFPHRNDVLQRISTPEELLFLRDATTFGQAR